MLTEIYIEALLVDEELADQVQAALMAGEIQEATAFLAWWLLAAKNPQRCKQRRQPEEDNRADEKLIVRLLIFQLVADPIFHILVLTDYERP